MTNKNTSETYKRISSGLRTFLRNNWNFQEEDIEEIIQDVIYIFHKKNLDKQFRWNKSWFYKTTYNKAIDKIKYKKIEEPIYFNSEIISNYLNPEEELLNNVEREWVMIFLNSLDPINRRISYLYYYENIKCKKIGQIFQMPTGTVKYRLSNIRKLLKEEYIKYDKN